MKKVSIVTDSTNDLPQDYISRYGISVVPESFVWDGITYRDAIDLSPDEFYKKLVGSSSIPTTSQPSPAEFLEVYKPIESTGKDILSMQLSSKLSGTIDSARQAAEFVSATNIHVFDSYSASLGLGFTVLAAAKAANKGASLEECIHIAERVRANTSVAFVISTLEYLHKGGRIGGAAALVGSALGIKPILGVKDGAIDALDKVRTFNKALNRMVEIVLSSVRPGKRLWIGAVHVEAEPQAKSMLDGVLAQFDSSLVEEKMIVRATPVIGIHTGPGTIGLVISHLD